MPEGMSEPAVVTIDGDRIVELSPAVGPVPARTLAPGFVDLQVNGLDDIDVAEARGEDWERLDAMLLASGVTAWCPTLVTAPLDRYPGRLARVATAAARPGGARPLIAGAHIEGPFLGGAPGAHRRQWLRPLGPGFLDELPGIVRIVTLAPELDGAPEAIRALVARGVVVSLGHSSATAEEVDAAVGAGARMVTHLFNGMPAFHHRDPGVAGSALTDDRLVAGLIADLVHVHPSALDVAFRAKSAARIALVTDAVAWGAPSHQGRVALVDGAARLTDGTLAGSALTMDRAVANVVHEAGVALPDALVAASTTPAALLGLSDRGHIAVGCRADLVALGPDLAVQATWVGGRQVHP